MKLKTLLFFVGIFMSNLVAYSQAPAAKKREFKFGKIAPEEFLVKPTGKDSAAAAIKLFDVGNCYFQLNQEGEFVYIFERHIRYKILNKNGYDFANHKIGLYKGSGGKEELYNMEAATYNMVDGKMVTSKINKDAKFTEEYNKKYTFKKFALPNVKEGSIIEFKSVVKSDFIFNLPSWSFQSSIPTLYTEFNVRMPEYLKYKTNFTGHLNVNQTKHVLENTVYISGVPSTATYDQFALENVPALKDEVYITTMDDYIPTLDFELMGTDFPGRGYIDYTGTWPKIVAGLAKDDNFGEFLNKNAYAKSVLPTIIKGEKDSLAIVTLIFDYVKNNLKWNDDWSIYSSLSSPKAVFDKKSGNSADINLSLVSLLKEARIEAYPLLISTRENGVHPGLPNVSKFNSVVAHVIVNNQPLLLDATNKDLLLGMLSYDNLNHQGLSINLKELKSAWVSTEPTFKSERIFMSNLTLNKENKLTGIINQYARGYAALNLRSKYRTTNNEAEYLKNFKKDKVGLEVTKYQLLNLDNPIELLTESLDVVIEDNVEEAGNLIYFMPLLYERTKDNMFKHEERLFPVDFAYPFKENYRITINFPETYEINKLPQSVSYKMPDDKGSFTISYLSEGSTVAVTSIITLTKSIYTPEEYFDLKQLFKAIIEKQAEQIVFKKKV